MSVSSAEFGRTLSHSVSAMLLSLALRPAFWLGLGAFSLSLVLWLHFHSRIAVSQAFPLVAMGIALTVVFGSVYLGESVGLPRTSAVGLILVGVVLLSFS